jgi:hypothetical protein
MKRFACPECPPKQRSIFPFKGLCTDCTTYDDGEVIDPVYRVKCDEFGNPIQVIHTRRQAVDRATGAPIQPGFRQAKKPTKRQMARAQPEIAKDIEGPIPEMTEILAGGEEE